MIKKHQKRKKFENYPVNSFKTYVTIIRKDSQQEKKFVWGVSLRCDTFLKVSQYIQLWWPRGATVKFKNKN